MMKLNLKHLYIYIYIYEKLRSHLKYVTHPTVLLTLFIFSLSCTSSLKVRSAKRSQGASSDFKIVNVNAESLDQSTLSTNISWTNPSSKASYVEIVFTNDAACEKEIVGSLTVKPQLQEIKDIKANQFRYVCLFALDSKKQRISAALNNPYEIKTPEPTSSATPEPTVSPDILVSPSHSPSPSPSASPSPSVSPSPSISPTPNATPVAVDDISSTNINVAKVIAVLANDTDADLDTLTIDSVTNGARGTTTTDGTTITYTPNSNVYGSDTFTYTISDGHGGTDTGTVVVYINTPFTWVGAGADANWATTANWLGGAAPGSGNVAVFNGFCSSNCNPTIASNINVSGIYLDSTYAGTITQNPSITVTVGTSFYRQFGGTFNGSDATISFAEFTLGGGIFNSTSGILNIGYDVPDYTSQTDGFTITGGTFNHMNGTLRFMGRTLAMNTLFLIATKIDVQNSLTLNNLTISLRNRAGAGNYLGIEAAIASGDVLEVLGDLTIDGGLVAGPGHVNLHGNLILNCAGTGTGDFCARLPAGGYEGSPQGPAWVKMVGATPQTYARAANAVGPALWINKPNGVGVTAAVGTTDLRLSKFRLESGDFTAPTGDLEVGYIIRAYDNSVDGFIVNSGNFFHNSGTVKITGGVYQANHEIKNAVVFDVPSTLSLNNLSMGSVDQAGDNEGHSGKIGIAAGDTLLVAGNLTLWGGYYGGGTIEVSGDITYSCASSTQGGACPQGGSTIVKSVGTSDKSFYTVNTGGTPIGPPLTVAKTGAGLYSDAAASNLRLTKFRLESGSFRAPTGILSLGVYQGNDPAASTDGFTILAGTTFEHNFGTVDFSPSAFIQYSSSVRNLLVIDVPNLTSFYNVRFASRDNSSSLGYDSVQVAIAANSTLIALNSIEHRSGRVSGGTLELQGPSLTFTCVDGSSGANCARGGSTAIKISSTSSVTCTAATDANIPDGLWSIDTGASTVTLGSAVNLNGTGQDLNLISGTLDMAGFDLTIADSLWNTGVITRNGGNLVYVNAPSGPGTINP